MKGSFLIIVALLVIIAGAVTTIAILNSDMPDIWKWFLLK